MLLHNFVIERNNQLDDPETFSIDMDAVQQQLTEQTGEPPRPIVVDNNEPRRVGRPSQEEILLQQRGDNVRFHLTTKLATHSMRRPLQHGIRYNSYGHIYLDA